MKFLTSLLLPALASMAVAEELAAAACPTVTKEVIAPVCGRKCNNPNCNIVSTVENPCGCPRSLPTATLYYPCDADCPYDGCNIKIRTKALPCPTTTSAKPTSTSSKPSVTTSITFLHPPTKTTTTTTSKPTSKTCPTVTTTWMPDDCEPIRCPLPTCTSQQLLPVPCGCSITTALAVVNCPTACAGGCLTTTDTISEKCARETGAAA